MKYTPYESPFVLKARKTALNRAKSAQKGKKNKKTVLAPSPRSGISVPVPATAPRTATPWNSEVSRNGLFDSSLKKVEIFKVRPRTAPKHNRDSSNIPLSDDSNSQPEVFCSSITTSPQRGHTTVNYQKAPSRTPLPQQRSALDNRQELGNSCPSNDCGGAHGTSSPQGTSAVGKLSAMSASPIVELRDASPSSQQSSKASREDVKDQLLGESTTKEKNNVDCSTLCRDHSYSDREQPRAHTAHTAHTHTSDSHPVAPSSPTWRPRNDPVLNGRSDDSTPRRDIEQQISRRVLHSSCSPSQLGSTGLRSAPRANHISRATSPIKKEVIRRLLTHSKSIQKRRQQPEVHKSTCRNMAAGGWSTLSTSHRPPSDEGGRDVGGDALASVLSTFIATCEGNEKLHTTATQNLMQSVALLAGERYPIASVRAKNRNNEFTDSKEVLQNSTSENSSSDLNAATALQQMSKVAHTIFDKLEVLDAKEKHLDETLNAPLSTSRVGQCGNLDPTDSSKLLNFTALAPSLPQSLGHYHHEHVGSRHDVTAIIQKGGNSPLKDVNGSVCAPRSQSTFETMNAKKYGEFLLRFNDPEEHNPDVIDGDRDSSEKYDEIRGQGLPLLLCAPGPREEVLQYRRELRRMPIYRQNHGPPSYETAERLTEVLLDGILDDVCEEIDSLFADIAHKVVGRI